MELEFEERSSDKKKEEDDNRNDNNMDAFILIYNSEDFDSAKEVLDENNIQYTLNSKGELMVSSDELDNVIDLLEDADVLYGVDDIRDDDGCLNERILIDERVFNSEEFDLVEKLFDENGIRYDFDSGDRIMISSADVNTAIEILNNAGIYAEQV